MIGKNATPQALGSLSTIGKVLPLYYTDVITSCHMIFKDKSDDLHRE